jgi:hypothetical protein
MYFTGIATIDEFVRLPINEQSCNQISRSHLMPLAIAELLMADCHIVLAIMRLAAEETCEHLTMVLGLQQQEPRNILFVFAAAATAAAPSSTLAGQVR